VISAVGHETDVTIADFVADVRAPTPSAAAELVSPDAEELRLHVRSLVDACLAAVQDGLRDRERSLATAGRRLSPAGLRSEVDAAQERVRRLGRGLRESGGRVLAALSERLDACADRLDAVSPLGTLRRGYAIVEDRDGDPVTSARDVGVADVLAVRLQDGRLHVHVDAKQEVP
jgi:exodeoxyribonuclease VII large subunit